MNILNKEIKYLNELNNYLTELNKYLDEDFPDDIPEPEIEYWSIKDDYFIALYWTKEGKANPYVEIKLNNMTAKFRDMDILLDITSPNQRWLLYTKLSNELR